MQETIKILKKILTEMPDKPFKGENGVLTDWEKGYNNALEDFKNHIQIKIKSLSNNTLQ